MFEDFEPFALVTQQSPPVTIQGVTSLKCSFEKPALLLLHGFPQTHHMWHRVAPALTNAYQVVVPDLRGYGDSSKPDEIAQYAKSRMAHDLISVMSQLGHNGKFFVCAHDRGARVAHKLIVDHPDRVLKAIFLDICPTLAMYESTNFNFASQYFHWFLLIQDAPLPETMILPEARKIAEMFLGGVPDDGTNTFQREAFEAYVKGLSDPACVHAMCNDYRASATVDLEESRHDLKNGRLNRVPLYVLWAKQGVIEGLFDALVEWRRVSAAHVEVRGHAVDSGHYIPEANPGEVLECIREFFGIAL